MAMDLLSVSLMGPPSPDDGKTSLLYEKMVKGNTANDRLVVLVIAHEDHQL